MRSDIGRLTLAFGILAVVALTMAVVLCEDDSEGATASGPVVYATTTSGDDTLVKSIKKTESNDYVEVTFGAGSDVYLKGTGNDAGECEIYADVLFKKAALSYSEVGAYFEDASGNTFNRTSYKTSQWSGRDSGFANTNWLPDPYSTLDTTLPADYTLVVFLSNGTSEVRTMEFAFTLNITTVHTYTTSVTYDANSGSDAPSAYTSDLQYSLSAITGTEPITISSDVPTREGYTFEGWSTTKSGNASIQPGSVQQLDKGKDYTLYAQWLQKDAVLKLMNGDELFESVLSKWGSEAPIPPDIPVKDGYTFVGWSATKDSETAEYAGQGGVVLKDDEVILYAVWSKDPVNYVLKFDNDGGTGAPSTLSKLKETAETWPFTITDGYPSKDGFQCVGWSDTQGGGKAYVSGDTVTLTWDSPSKTLYPVWVEETVYTLSFSAEGASDVPEPVSGKSITGSADVAIPSGTPTRTGYEFLGWSSSDGATEAERLPGATITLTETSVTLYAVWKKVPVTFSVTFEADGDGGQMPTISPVTTLETEHLFDIPETHPTKTGYKFLGWSATEGSALAEYLAGGSITLKDSSPTVTLHAAWKALDAFTLSFDVGEGSGAPDDVIGYSETSSCTVPVPTVAPTRTDYRFVGWSETSGGEATVARGSEFTMTARAVTLFAVWEYSTENTFTLKFDIGAGSGTFESKSVTVTAPQCTTNLPSESPELEGFEFFGWSHRAGATEAEYLAGGSITLTSTETTLYAVYGALVTYTMTFDANGGTDAPRSESDESARGSVVLTIPTDVPKRDGFKFLGWSESELAVQPSYQPGQSVTVTADMKLYAVWNDMVEYTLSFDANGGEGQIGPASGRSDAGYCDLDIPETVPTRDGFSFAGWALDEAASGAGYMPGTVFRATARDTTLYAVWVQLPSVQFTVTGTTTVPAGGEVSMTVVTDPSDASVTASGPTWLAYADGKIAGNAPSTPGDYQIVLVATASGHSRTVNAVTVTVLAPEDSVMVSLQANGGKLNDPYRFVLNGGTLTEPEEPTRDGYSFDGWYTQSGDRYDFDTPVTGDLVLVAHWTDDGKDSGSPIWMAVVVFIVLLVAVIVMRRLL